MKLKHLIKLLKEFDQDLEVIFEKWSDYTNEGSAKVMEVRKQATYYERYYPHQYEKKPHDIIKALYIGRQE